MNSKIFLFICLSILCHYPYGLKAQNPDSTLNIAYKKLFRLYAPFSEVTVPFVGDLQFGENFSNYILTAQVEPHFFLFGESNTKFAIDFYFGIDVRILRENSLPVRTPSTRPGGTFYYRTNFIPDSSVFDYITFQVMHHSNGQDGCALNGYSYDANNNCIQDRNLLPGESIFNQYNGSFSTNFIEIGYNLSRQRSNVNVRRLSNYVFPFKRNTYTGGNILNYFYVGYQHHFGNIEPALRGRYGLHKLIFKYKRISSTRWINSDVSQSEADRLLIRLSSNISKIDKLPNFNFYNRFALDLKYYFTWRKVSSKSTAFFLMAGYKGQDEYNIYLEDDFLYAGFGLSVGNLFYIQAE